jgi:cold shock CspA family protein
MQVPVQIDIQGEPPIEGLRAQIEAHLAELEKRFGRITAGRVCVKMPSGHHRQGAALEVRIQLSLPQGRHVDVDRTPKLDERHSDPYFAINDAFHRARRQLQDEARRMQRAVKHHDGPAIASVARIDPSGDYGFLETDDGSEIYFHRNSLIGAKIDKLDVGTRVTFIEEAGNEGPQASTVKLLGKHSLRA